MYSISVDRPAATRVKAGVGVIVTDAAGRILLERRRDNGRWGLPGGGVEPGESVAETALREVREETGLEVRLTVLVGVYSEPGLGRIVTYPDKGDTAQLVDTVVAAEAVSGDLTVSGESLEVAFFAPERLPGDIVPPARQPLADFLAGLRGQLR